MVGFLPVFIEIGGGIQSGDPELLTVSGGKFRNIDSCNIRYELFCRSNERLDQLVIVILVHTEVAFRFLKSNYHGITSEKGTPAVKPKSL